MAWNGSTGVKPHVPQPKKSMATRGLVAGLIVAIGAVGVLVFLMKAEHPSDERQMKATSAISEAKPALTTQTNTTQAPASQVATIEKAVATPALTNAPAHKTKLWEKGIRVAKARSEAPKRFKHDVEEDIAFFIETEPGAMIFGEIPYDQRFVEQLIESFKDPVEINPDDSDDLKELKKLVQETKRDLERNMKAGIDLAELFRQSRQQLMEMGSYRREAIETMMDIAVDSKANGTEFEAFVEAMNKNFEAKGIKPFTPTQMTYKLLELRGRKRNAQ